MVITALLRSMPMHPSRTTLWISLSARRREYFALKMVMLPMATSMIVLIVINCFVLRNFSTGPYPAVNIGDINNLDAVFTPGLHLLETSGEDIVSAFINRHIVMPRLNVIDFVCNRIDPAVFITAHILLNGFADSPINQL